MSVRRERERSSVGSHRTDDGKVQVRQRMLATFEPIRARLRRKRAQKWAGLVGVPGRTGRAGPGRRPHAAGRGAVVECVHFFDVWTPQAVGDFAEVTQTLARSAFRRASWKWVSLCPRSSIKSRKLRRPRHRSTFRNVRRWTCQSNRVSIKSGEVIEKILPERVQSRTAEQTVDIPVPQRVKKSVTSCRVYHRSTSRVVRRNSLWTSQCYKTPRKSKTFVEETVAMSHSGHGSNATSDERATVAMRQCHRTSRQSRKWFRPFHRRSRSGHASSAWSWSVKSLGWWMSTARLRGWQCVVYSCMSQRLPSKSVSERKKERKERKRRKGEGEKEKRRKGEKEKRRKGEKEEKGEQEEKGGKGGEKETRRKGGEKEEKRIKGGEKEKKEKRRKGEKEKRRKGEKEKRRKGRGRGRGRGR